ncbi:violaxanthin de-epoxidase [Aureococcus anophagefferens]|nr:violaxanthin de-epoxidase [Aureococcus anophagefferens]
MRRAALLVLLPLAAALAPRHAKTHAPTTTQPAHPLKALQLAAGGAALAASFATALPANAVIQDTAAVGKCVVTQCTGKLAKCLTSPKCAANLVCINTCTGRADESECQIRCGDLFENDVVGEFNACAVSQKKCVPQRGDDGAWPVPPQESYVKAFNTQVFDGRWYISAGLNPVFDTFDCQVHFFTAPTPKTLYGKLNWRIAEPDGEFFTKDTIQRFVEDEKQPGILYNHDNEYLHYQDDWYVLDYDGGKGDKDSKGVRPRLLPGRNDAWDGYGGAVLYTRTPYASKAVNERCAEACKKAGIDFAAFACPTTRAPPSPRQAAPAPRERVKVLLVGEQALQEEATQVRRAAVSTIAKDAKGAEKAALKLEKLVEGFEAEAARDVLRVEAAIERDVVAAEKELVKDATNVEKELEKDVGGLFKKKR